MPDLTMLTVTESHEGELTCFCQKTDSAGKAFLSWLMNIANSNDSYVHVECRDTQGHILNTWRVLPVSGFKLTTSTMAVAGADLIILASAHHVSSEPGRANQAMGAVITGVFGATNTPGDSAFPETVLLNATEPTPSEPVDYTRIGQMMVDAVTSGFATFGSEGTRLAIMHKVWDAEVALWDKANNSDPRLQHFRDLVAGFIRDRAYEGDMAAEATDPKTGTTATAVTGITTATDITGETNTNATE